MQVQRSHTLIAGLLAVVACWTAFVLVGPMLVGVMHRDAWSGVSAGVTAVILVAGLVAIGLAGRLVHLIRQGFVRR